MGYDVPGPVTLVWRVFQGTLMAAFQASSAMVPNHLRVHGSMPSALVQCPVPGHSSRECDSIVLGHGPGICIFVCTQV